MRENGELIVNWSKFKSDAKGKTLEKAKDGYIEFYKMLDEVDFELVSDYIENQEKVELVYKFDDDVKLNIIPNAFKNQTYKSIVNFKNTLTVNNDELIKFIRLAEGGNLIAKIKTFDGGVVDIDIGAYGKFNKGRQGFYKRLKEINGYTSDNYTNNKSKMNIYIDNVKLNPISSSDFKESTYKAIIKFKEQLIKNRDVFIRFIGLSSKGSLVIKIRTFDGGIVDIDIRNYTQWNKGRQDFYSKLKEVDGYINNSYINADSKMDIYIDDIHLNPISSIAFKSSTYKSIINFKNNLKENGDRFIAFTGLSDRNSLIAKIKTFDYGKVNMDINGYSRFNKSRRHIYDYCKEKGYKILSPYISSEEKILIDFNCEHNPHWITPSALKQNQGCPVCSESKGEKKIREYLEDNSINFKQEHKFEDCKNKRSLPFDFYIPEYNLCIEFDGIQHFEAFNHFGGKEKLKTTKKRDKIKNDYCMENSINLLRIPYWELDNIEKILDKEFEKLREMSDKLGEAI